MDCESLQTHLLESKPSFSTANVQKAPSCDDPYAGIFVLYTRVLKVLYNLACRLSLEVKIYGDSYNYTENLFTYLSRTTTGRTEENTYVNIINRCYDAHTQQFTGDIET